MTKSEATRLIARLVRQYSNILLAESGSWVKHTKLDGDFLEFMVKTPDGEWTFNLSVEEGSIG